MRILHWYPNFLGGGGVANAVLGLAKAQAELGAEVVIASAEPEGQPLYQSMDEALGSVRLIRWQPVFTLQVGSLRWRKLLKTTIKQMEAFKPDIVHIHGEFNPDNLLVPRLFKAPLVLSPHGAFHPVVLKKSKRVGKRLYIGMAKRLLYKRLKAFHALSPAERNHIRLALGEIPIYTVPQGASPHVAIHSKGSDNCRATQKIRFAFVGRLDIYTKGLDILIEAFADAIKFPLAKPMELIIVGPDWQGSMEKLKLLAHRKGYADKVVLTGAVPGYRVAEILAQSDVYIHLSRHEVFGLSVAEALLAAKPSILSAEIGTVSYQEIRDLPFVKVIPPEKEATVKAMLEFAENLDRLRAIAESHREQILDFFNWKKVAQTHLEHYEKLLGGNL